MASYYVKTLGDDGNTGLSDAQAWQTLAKVASFSFSPGDTIYFKAGNYWDEYLIFPSSGTAGNPITLTSYGSGAKPMFRATTADVSWTDMGDGIYRASNFIHDEYSLFFEDNISYPIASSELLGDGIWYTTWAGTYIYYRPTSGTPALHVLNYSKVLWSTYHGYTPSIDISNKNYITIDGLQFKTGGYSICAWNNDVDTQTGIIIKNCDFEMCARAIFLLQGSAGIENVTIQDNYFYRCMNAICAYCTDQTSGDDGYEGSADGYCDNWDIHGNEMEECGVVDDSGTSWGSGDREAMGFQNMINSVIYNNYPHGGCQTPLIFWDRVGCSSKNNLIYKNRFYNTSEDGTMQGVVFSGESGYIGHEGNELYCNIFYNCGTVAALDIVEETHDSSGIVSNTVYNNIFVGNSRPVRILNSFSEEGFFKIKNNIMYGAFDIYTVQIAGAPSDIEIDYNNYYRTSGSHLFLYNGGDKSFAQWQALGFDTNSILSDPQILGVETYNFHLYEASAAIGAGVDVGLEYDYEYNLWLDPPSMGIYEEGVEVSSGVESSDVEYSSAYYESVSYDAMDWGPKYRLQFHDIWDVKWTALLHFRDYKGSITDLQGSEEAIVFDFQNGSDDVFDPLKPSSVTFNIVNTENFAFSDIYTAADMQIWVEIFQGDEADSDTGVPYWVGWVDPNSYEEPYDVEPNVVSMTCIDGLSLLEEIPYVEEDSEGDTEYYNGRYRESQMLLQILGKIGYSEFKEFVNLYEEDMADSVDDSPIDQLMIDADFAGERYCDEVLTMILNKYGACIRQVDGVFCIYRPKEIISTTVFGRHFTSSTIKTSILYTADQFINRSSHNTNLKQVPGGIRHMINPAKKITLHQDYGNKESWIENWEFKPDTIVEGTPLNYQVDYWTKSTPYLIQPVTNIGEIEGVYMVLNNPFLEVNSYYLDQTFGDYIKQTDDACHFSIDYLFYNGEASDIEIYSYFVQIYSPSADKYLHIVGEYLEWTSSESSILLDDTAPANGSSGWRTFSMPVNGIPADGPLVIKLNALFAGGHAVLIAYKNVKFYSTSDAILTKIRPHHGPFPNLARLILGVSKYVKTYVDKKEVTENEIVRYNDTDGEELEYDMLLGDVTDAEIDNVVEQFAGALTAPVLGYRVDRIIMEGYDGRARITCNGINATIIFGDDLADTVGDFVDVNYDLFKTVNITLSCDSNGYELFFTSDVQGMEFEGSTTVLPLEGTLDGTVTENYVSATSLTNLRPTSEWQPRYESSDEGSSGRMQTLLDVIADEIQHQYSRSTDYIQMPIQETSGESTLNLIGNIQDTESQLNGVNRKYIIARGTFEVRSRRWNLDLQEIVE